MVANQVANTCCINFFVENSKLLVGKLVDESNVGNPAGLSVTRFAAWFATLVG